MASQAQRRLYYYKDGETVMLSEDVYDCAYGRRRESFCMRKREQMRKALCPVSGERRTVLGAERSTLRRMRVPADVQPGGRMLLPGML